MTANVEINHFADPSPAPRYEILTVASDDAADVIEWGATDDLAKAEKVFEVVKAHAAQHGVGKVSLWDRETHTNRLSYAVTAL